ncbi:MAG: hypothetical protein NT080_08060 [Spirochaetes bacterium]|nr:hypothetical protein [Spirochaetota bacterium]
MENANELIRRSIEWIDGYSFLKSLPWWGIAAYIAGFGVLGTLGHGLLARNFNEKTPKFLSGLWGAIWAVISMAAGMPALREMIRMLASDRNWQDIGLKLLSLIGEKSWNIASMATWFMMVVILLAASASAVAGALLSSLFARIWLLGKKVKPFAWSGPTLGVLGGIGFGSVYGISLLVGKVGFIDWVRAFDGSLPTAWPFWFPYVGFGLFLFYALALLVLGALENGAWAIARAAVSLTVGACFFVFMIAAAPLAGVICAGYLVVAWLGSLARKKPTGSQGAPGGNQVQPR